jgi:hypothetical protein
MKRFALLVAAASVAASAGVALTGDAKANNGNDLNKNCFGQGRSDYASSHTDTGQIISGRAHNKDVTGAPNQNVLENRAYKEGCQGSPS